MFGHAALSQTHKIRLGRFKTRRPHHYLSYQTDIRKFWRWPKTFTSREILALEIRDIEFDDHGAVMIVRRGKTGDRRARLIEST